MSWQTAVLEFPDVELEVIQGVRTALEARGRSDVLVTRGIPASRQPFMVAFVRDGGSISNFRDVARIRCLTWGPGDQADGQKQTNDLARLVVALMQTLVDGVTILQVEHVSGPYEVADDTGQPQRYLLFDVHARGGDLA